MKMLFKLKNILCKNYYKNKQYNSLILYMKDSPFVLCMRRASSQTRISELNIQMLSSNLHAQIFKESEKKTSNKDFKKSITHLQQHNLWNKKTSIIDEVKLQLPSLKGKDLEEHFRSIAEKQSKDYQTYLTTLLNSSIPSQPVHWNYSPGWTKYNNDGTYCKVDFPDCKAIVFDIEVCMSEGSAPTLACAVSDKFWYSWCSNSLIDSDKKLSGTLEDMISFGSDGSKIIVGHNVGFDRKAIKEEYFINNSGTRFLDTMSLHIAVSGLIEEQRGIYLKNKKAEKKIRLPWMNVTCQNSLKEVYSFYCKKELEKESRELFVKGTMQDIRDNFQNLAFYCAKDVLATKNVLQKLLPIFLLRFPHPVTFAGMLEMSITYLPVNKNWTAYIESAEKEYVLLKQTLTDELTKLTLEALKLLKDNQYKKDAWLWDLDWNLPKGKVKTMKDYPVWYRKLCSKSETLSEDIIKPESMSSSLRIVPKVLRLTWNGYPLHYHQGLGWGYLCIKDIEEEFDETLSDFPYQSLKEICLVNKNNTVISDTAHDIGIPNVTFYQLPHKNGKGFNVGNPLAEYYLIRIEDGTLSSAESDIAERVLKRTKVISYWKNNRDRISSQIIGWTPQQNLPSIIRESAQHQDNDVYGAILPQMVTAGTITRRAVEKTWMTASNAYIDRIGSELKAMVKAPPGYHFVGADVDSQELWIAAVLGDSYFAGIHGATALGWMVLQGKKADSTDMHSKTAATVGISRNDAKVINYGRIYGAGLKFLQRLIKQFNPMLNDQEVKSKAFLLFATTKGEKGWRLNSVGVNLANMVGVPYSGEPLTRKQIWRLIARGKRKDMYVTFDEIKDGEFEWVGGSESHMFNCLESVARTDAPATPVLGARITRALEPWCVDDQFMTSRVNWVVQSSAVDFLHLMLVCMRWLIDEYDIKGRFSISIHDEVRYLVESEDRYRAALALHITNLLTRSFISMRLGMNDLPQSVAFFESVDVDEVLRKEPFMDCVTPSNPRGLKQGYNIPTGESLAIHQAITKTNGRLDKISR